MCCHGRCNDYGAVSRTTQLFLPLSLYLYSAFYLSSYIFTLRFITVFISPFITLFFFIVSYFLFFPTLPSLTNSIFIIFSASPSSLFCYFDFFLLPFLLFSLSVPLPFRFFPASVNTYNLSLNSL